VAGINRVYLFLWVMFLELFMKYIRRKFIEYFAVGKVLREQIKDAAARKGMSVTDAEKWLAPNLGY
jgi:hypothetical protein